MRCVDAFVWDWDLVKALSFLFTSNRRSPKKFGRILVACLELGGAQGLTLSRLSSARKRRSWPDSFEAIRSYSFWCVHACEVNRAINTYDTFCRR